MTPKQAQQTIEAASAGTKTDATELRAAVDLAFRGLDDGSLRVAERRDDGSWQVNIWLKQAVLHSFGLFASLVVERGDLGNNFDKMPRKTTGWTEANFLKAGFRMVPPANVRYGAFIAPGVVLMPSFVNLGAYVGAGTMIDTWASVGSCAQIGANCHISAGAGIGGVLEPLQANPVIIEDNCFIGARSEVVEGVFVGEGSVLAMGVFITMSTKIVDRATGEISYGKVPPFSVVVPGSLPDPKGGPSLACAVIIKTVDAKTRAKTAINDLLR
ncbi:MAG: 2,3,4,5-tetrahydropyridine-2,6-dicarboxylate N-succinyltransferase [Robiginitomaculum sp.]|nr:2,3,4,5-tetrahydropyridine-2,6-dicarboxylate N-succinyltransferase [Robiginitomaculum sp.]